MDCTTNFQKHSLSFYPVFFNPASFAFVFLLLYSTFINAHVSMEDSTYNAREAFQDSIFNLAKAKNGFRIDTSETTINTAISDVNKHKKKTKKVDTTHYSPKKAAIWGASFPGLGQIYMKKYWKLPIVYGVLGATLYFVVANGKNLKTYNNYLRNSYNNVSNPSPIDQLSLEQIEAYRNNYRRNVHIASFATIFAWGLSIVDGVVDAHLHSFDISDNLSFKLKPSIQYTNYAYYCGIGITLNVK
ncbi:MAG: hypothetical protein KDD21_02220 [Bacteroidetes bacterium]|nr:hypothetical protein [Bacteroidota bacterium]